MIVSCKLHRFSTLFYSSARFFFNHGLDIHGATQQQEQRTQRLAHCSLAAPHSRPSLDSFTDRHHWKNVLPISQLEASQPQSPCLRHSGPIPRFDLFPVLFRHGPARRDQRFLVWPSSTFLSLSCPVSASHPMDISACGRSPGVS